MFLLVVALLFAGVNCGTVCDENVSGLSAYAGSGAPYSSFDKLKKDSVCGSAWLKRYKGDDVNYHANCMDKCLATPGCVYAAVKILGVNSFWNSYDNDCVLFSCGRCGWWKNGAGYTTYRVKASKQPVGGVSHAVQPNTIQLGCSSGQLQEKNDPNGYEKILTCSSGAAVTKVSSGGKVFKCPSYRSVAFASAHYSMTGVTQYLVTCCAKTEIGALTTFGGGINHLQCCPAGMSVFRPTSGTYCSKNGVSDIPAMRAISIPPLASSALVPILERLLEAASLDD